MKILGFNLQIFRGNLRETKTLFLPTHCIAKLGKTTTERNPKSLMTTRRGIRDHIYDVLDTA